MSIIDKYPEKDANYVNTVSSLVMVHLTRSQLAGSRTHLPDTLSILPHKTVQTTESQNKEKQLSVNFHFDKIKQ
jgi:hypothetical protein